MKYLFYIIGIFLGLFASVEYIGVGIFFITIGIAVHITDINQKIDTRLTEIEKRIQSDHAYLKRDIKNLVNQK